MTRSSTEEILTSELQQEVVAFPHIFERRVHAVAFPDGFERRVHVVAFPDGFERRVHGSSKISTEC